MTEKRFTIHNRGLQGQFIKENGEFLTVDMVCEMLNDFYEENKQLNKENQKLNEKVHLLTLDLITTKSYKQLEKELNRFKKKNKELKQKNRELEEELDCIWDSYENYYGMSIRNTEWYGFKGDV